MQQMQDVNFGEMNKQNKQNYFKEVYMPSYDDIITLDDLEPKKGDK